MSELKLVNQVRALVRDVPDFPQPGILFRDITPVLQSGPTLRRIVDHYAERYAASGVDRFVGIESRGFLFATAIGYALGIGVAIVRKPGKLPAAKERVEYSLEYGTDALEIHRDAIAPRMTVVIVDDLLATGGTANAAVELVEKLDGTVQECAFLIELTALGGRARLRAPAYALLDY